jgi:hypothetical protein
LQLTPHLHVLFPEGRWDAQGGFVPLPPPAAGDWDAVLRRVVRAPLPEPALLESLEGAGTARAAQPRGKKGSWNRPTIDFAHGRKHSRAFLHAR